MKPDFDAIFNTALLIRRVEERIVELYPSDCIQSPVHLSLGQEHHIAALSAALDSNDAVFSSYRCHAAYLARGGALAPFFAELFGKASGISGGKAGSMHLTAPDKLMLGSSGIVGAVLPHAVGYAYGFRLDHKPQICVSITGDGSMEEGVFAELLNFAKLRRAPILFVIEQNDWAVHTRKKIRQSFDLEKWISAYDMPFCSIADGMDMPLVFETVTKLRPQVIENGPALLEIKTCRYAEHVGINTVNDTQSRAEITAAKANDPLLTNFALREKFLPEIDAAIEAAVTFAKTSAWPSADALLRDVIS